MSQTNKQVSNPKNLAIYQMLYFSINPCGTPCSTYLQEFKQPIKNERGGGDENVKKNTSVLFPLCSNCHLFCIIPVNVIRSSDAAQQARFITFLLFIDFYIYATIKYKSTILHPLDSK